MDHHHFHSLCFEIYLNSACWTFYPKHFLLCTVPFGTASNNTYYKAFHIDDKYNICRVLINQMQARNSSGRYGNFSFIERFLETIFQVNISYTIKYNLLCSITLLRSTMDPLVISTLELYSNFKVCLAFVDGKTNFAQVTVR